MKKSASITIGVYLLYALLIGGYLYFFADTSIPKGLQGTSADPTTFLSHQKIEWIQSYSKIKNILYFVSLPFDWVLYFLFLALGFSNGLQQLVGKISKRKMIQFPLFLLTFLIIIHIFTLPIEYIGYRVSQSYGLSTQSLHSWLREHIIDFWVTYVFMLLVFSVVYWLLEKKPKKWWLYSWFLSIPFTLFITFIQPVMIDPLYNNFTPIYNKQLEAKILTLAKKADIPANHVYQVDMSEKTNTMNAYVTGIGSNSRIVLWDTTLQQLSESEILFIMAHEMAHYVKHHIYYGIAMELLLSFLGFWVVAIFLRIASKKGTFSFRSQSSFATFPYILLVFSILSFGVTPLTNYVSRYEERVSDSYALQLTHDSKAATAAFQALVRNSLSEVNPPGIVKFFRYSHPTMLERLEFIEKWGEEHPQ